MINILYFLVLILSQCISCSNASEVPVMATLLHRRIQSSIKLSAVNENAGFQYLEYFAQDPEVLKNIVLRSRHFVDIAKIKQAPDQDQLKWPEKTRVFLALIGAKLCESAQSESVKFATNMHNKLARGIYWNPNENKFNSPVVQDLLRKNWYYRPQYPNNSSVFECDVRRLLPPDLPAVKALSDDEAHVTLTHAQVPLAMADNERKSRQDVLIESAFDYFDEIYACHQIRQLNGKFGLYDHYEGYRRSRDPACQQMNHKLAYMSDFAFREYQLGDRLGMYHKDCLQVRQKLENQKQDLEKFKKALCEKFNQLTSQKHITPQKHSSDYECCVIA